MAELAAPPPPPLLDVVLFGACEKIVASRFGAYGRVPSPIHSLFACDLLSRVRTCQAWFFVTWLALYVLTLLPFLRSSTALLALQRLALLSLAAAVVVSLPVFDALVRTCCSFAGASLRARQGVFFCEGGGSRVLGAALE